MNAVILNSRNLVPVLAAAMLAFAGAANSQEQVAAVAADSLRVVPISSPCPDPINQTINVTPLVGSHSDFTAQQLGAPRAGLFPNNAGSNKHFLGRFDWKPHSRCCQITSATLTVNMHALQGGRDSKSSDAGNDSIIVMNAGQAVPPYSESVYSSWSFQAGQQATKTWNLTDPAVLQKLSNGGGLSFAVQDDTAVDSAKLVIQGCCLTNK